MQAWVIKKDRNYWDEIGGGWSSIRQATLYPTKGLILDFLVTYYVYPMCGNPKEGHPVKVKIEEV